MTTPAPGEGSAGPRGATWPVGEPSRQAPSYSEKISNSRNRTGTKDLDLSQSEARHPPKSPAKPLSIPKEGQNIPKYKQVPFSRALSRLLRHDAERQGLKIRSDGFCHLDQVLEVSYIKKFNPTMADLNTVVDSNDKKRLDLQQIDGQWMIRAVQGHTISAIADEDLLTAISTDIDQSENVFRYTEVFHGTYKHSLTGIMRVGLSRMKRNHIHMAPGLPGGGKVISGMRSEERGGETGKPSRPN